ncbi:MAG: peptidylprolyl isomerase [Bacteroidales bacterium]|jgi:cyclophilin family peptidyl-prolyl cis-trans isomerase|nr:peptidylprolyl isomerase [Bacteroidales bacterium]
MSHKSVLLICVLFLISLFSYSQENSDEKEFLITINTEYGKIKLILFDDTPLHKENFLNLAKAGVYDHIIFHRVINNFMIQSGDYTTRNKPINYDPRVIQSPIKAEVFPHHLHVHGAIGTARKGDDVNPERKSNSTQFYIIQNRKGAHHLDDKYTVFGQVMSGFEVLDLIAMQPTSNKDRPLNNIRITVDIDQVSRLDIEKFYNFTYK